MDEKGSSKDGRRNTKSSSSKSKSSSQGASQNGGLTTEKSLEKTRSLTAGAEATSPPVTQGNIDEPTPGPSGINNNLGRDAFLEELDALFSQRLTEFMGQENIEYNEFEGDCISPGQKQPSGSTAPLEPSFDVDAAIFQANQSTGVASGVNDSTLSADKTVPFMDQYFNDLQVVTRKGSAVTDSVAKIVNFAFTNKMADEVRSAKLKHFEIPSNCDGLDQVKVNQVIWNKMLPTTRGMDTKLQNTQNFLVAAGAGLSNIVSKFMSMKATDFTEETMKLLTTDMLTTQVLLGQANVELNHRRRELIRPDLSSSYSHLCSSNKPFTSFLFGDELTDSVKEISETNKVCEQIFPRGGGNTRPFRARGLRSRGYRYHPYQAGYGNDFTHHYPHVTYGRGHAQFPSHSRPQPRKPFLAKGRASHNKKNRKDSQ